VAKRDEYTADIDALDELDDFGDSDGDLDDVLEPDLDEEDLEGPDLDEDALVEDLEVALHEDLEVGDDLHDDEDVGPETKEIEDEDEALDDEDDDEEGEEALDVMLLTRESGLDEDFRLDDEPRDGLSNADAPISAGEFTCRSCFLVKRRPQLADAERMICLDCI
jgi:hypothetical protein